MEFFYPIGKDPENESLLKKLPKGYKFAAKIFNPFIKMSNGWKSDNTDTQDYPSTKDLLNYGEPVSWEDIRKTSCLHDIADMSIALAAAITGGGEYCREIYQRPDLANSIDESLDDRTFYPLEDQISEHIIHDILLVLASNGARRIKYATLYGEQGTYNINEITPENITSLCSGLITITDEKEDFVFTCYFDEVSVLFFAKEDCREVLAKTKLEGIIFGEKTPLVWEDNDYLLIR